MNDIKNTMKIMWNVKKNMKIKFNRSRNNIYGGKKIRKKKWQNNITTNKDEVAAAIKVIKEEIYHYLKDLIMLKNFFLLMEVHLKKLEKDWSKYYKSKNSISFNSAVVYLLLLAP